MSNNHGLQLRRAQKGLFATDLIWRKSVANRCAVASNYGHVVLFLTEERRTEFMRAWRKEKKLRKPEKATRDRWPENL